MGTMLGAMWTYGSGQICILRSRCPEREDLVRELKRLHQIKNTFQKALDGATQCVLLLAP